MNLTMIIVVDDASAPHRGYRLLRRMDTRRLLSWRLLDRPKNAILFTHVQLASLLGVLPSEFRQDVLRHKTSPWAIVWHCFVIGHRPRHTLC